MESEEKIIISLLPQYKKCHRCSQYTIFHQELDHDFYFVCINCNELIKWNFGTGLKSSRLKLVQIETLLRLYIDNKSIQETHYILSSFLQKQKMNIHTVARYFALFGVTALKFYEDQLSKILLEGEIEIDETHLYKEKKTSAPARQYSHHSVWLFGLRQRHSSKFVIISTKVRDSETLIPLIRKYVKIGSVIYTDSYSVYVDNKNRASKLMQYGYIHYYVNHKVQFVSLISNQIHTNSIEPLRKEVKGYLKKTRTVSRYKFAIARYYMQKLLTKQEQSDILIDDLLNSLNNEEDI